MAVAQLAWDCWRQQVLESDVQRFVARVAEVDGAAHLWPDLLNDVAEVEPHAVARPLSPTSCVRWGGRRLPCVGRSSGLLVDWRRRPLGEGRLWPLLLLLRLLLLLWLLVQPERVEGVVDVALRRRRLFEDRRDWSSCLRRRSLHRKAGLGRSHRRRCGRVVRYAQK